MGSEAACGPLWHPDPLLSYPRGWRSRGRARHARSCRPAGTGLGRGRNRSSPGGAGHLPAGHHLVGVAGLQKESLVVAVTPTASVWAQAVTVAPDEGAAPVFELLKGALIPGVALPEGGHGASPWRDHWGPGRSGRDPHRPAPCRPRPQAGRPLPPGSRSCSSRLLVAHCGSALRPVRNGRVEICPAPQGSCRNMGNYTSSYLQ